MTNRISRRQSLRLAGMVASSALLLPTRGRAQPRQVRIFDVLTYGATGDGKALDTQAIQRAIDEAAAAGANSQVLIRGGKKYLVGALQLKGGIDFHLADDAELLVSTRQEDYASGARRGTPATQPQGGRGGRGGGGGGGGVFTANEAHGLRITGTGSVNGRSPEFMTGYDEVNEWWRPAGFRPRLFQLTGCKDLQMTGVTLKQAPSWTVHLVGCEHALIDGIKILNQLDVPNCDGIDPDRCQDVEIRNCNIVCGDDAIVIKATRGGAQYGASRNIVVKDCVLETQDSGVKIGTETTADVHDIIFERCEIKTSCRGLTIQLRDEGSVYNIVFRDIKFTSRYFSDPWWGRGEAISFTAIPRSPQTKVGTIHDVKVQNVTGRAENSVRVNGHATSRVKDVTFENVEVTLDRWTKYPGAVFDNRPTTAIDAIEKHNTPGFSIRHADNVTLKKCKVMWGNNRPEYFTHAIEAENVTGLKTEEFVGEAAHPQRDKAISIT